MYVSALQRIQVVRTSSLSVNDYEIGDHSLLFRTQLVSWSDARFCGLGPGRTESHNTYKYTIDSQDTQVYDVREVGQGFVASCEL